MTLTQQHHIYIQARELIEQHFNGSLNHLVTLLWIENDWSYKQIGRLVGKHEAQIGKILEDWKKYRDEINNINN
jgi:hypothetical protein